MLHPRPVCNPDVLFGTRTSQYFAELRRIIGEKMSIKKIAVCNMNKHSLVILKPGRFPLRIFTAAWDDWAFVRALCFFVVRKCAVFGKISPNP